MKIHEVGIYAHDFLTLGLVSLLVAIVYVGPTVLYRLELGNNYHGISLPIGYDQTHYTTLIREIYDGNYDLNNGYLFEETHDPRANPDFISTTHVQFLPILLSAEIGKLFNLSLDNLDLLLKAVFPSLIFLALVILCLAFGTPRSLAVSVALFAVLFPQIWTGVLFFLPGWQPHASHLVFMRPAVSQVGYFLFVMTLYLLVKGFFQEKKWLVVIAGVFLGLLHYVYFYYWTFTTAILLLLFVCGLVFRASFFIRWSVFALLISFAVGAWAIIQYLSIHQQGVSDPDQFMSLRAGRIPYITGFQIFLIAYIVGNLIAFRKGIIPRTKVALYISIAGAHIACANAQVLVGTSLEPEHFELFVTSPIFTVILLCFLNDIGMEKVRSFIPNLGILKRDMGYSINVYFSALVIFCIGISWFFVPNLHSSANSVVGSLIRFLGGRLPLLASILIAMSFSVMILNASKVIHKNKSVLLILIIFIAGFCAQASHYLLLRSESWFDKIQDIAPALQWLQEHTPKESVVVAADASAGYICTYTDKNAYISGYGMPAVSSMKEWRLRLFSYLHFIGVEPGELRSLIDNRNPDYSRSVQFLVWGDRILSPKQNPKVFARGLYYDAVTQSELDNVIGAYEQFTHSDPIESLLKKFKVGYVLNSVVERLTVFNFRRPLDSLKCLRVVYSDENSKVYEINVWYENIRE